MFPTCHDTWHVLTAQVQFETTVYWTGYEWQSLNPVITVIPTHHALEPAKQAVR